MTKFILPLLVFACAGFSQGKDAPKIDPSTGLPKKIDKIAEKLADILQGANRENVDGKVHDEFNNLDARLKESLETKLKLGMKRNKLSKWTRVTFLTRPFSEYTKADQEKLRELRVRSFSQILVEASPINLGTRVIGYFWTVEIGRFVKTRNGKEINSGLAKWKVAGGLVSNSASLKEEIDSTLDKIFLAYLELPEDGEKPKK